MLQSLLCWLGLHPWLPYTLTRDGKETYALHCPHCLAMHNFPLGDPLWPEEWGPWQRACKRAKVSPSLYASHG